MEWNWTPRRRNWPEKTWPTTGWGGKIITGDLTKPALLPQGKFSLVVSNPPYFSVGAGDSGGPARSEERLSLEQLCAAAGRLSRNGGRFALCHRPGRLPELMERLRGAGLEPKRLQFAHHNPDKPPFTALLECVKQGRPGLEVLPPLFTGAEQEE